MKKLYALLILSLFTFTTQAQVVFSENIGNSGSGNLAISATTFQNGAPIVFSGDADTRTTTASSGYTGASAGRNVFFAAAGARFFRIDGINTSAYSTANLQLTFGYLTTTITAQMVVEVSTDNGDNWSPLSFTNNTNTSWNLVTISSGIPSSATLSLRYTAPVTSGGMRIDDIIISNVSASCPLTLGAATAACDASTLALDNYTVTIPFTGGGTGSYTITGGTVGGDNPNTVASGNIVITGLTEGTNFSITVTGNTCSFTVTGNAPSCKPINTLPYYESFNYADGDALGSTQRWNNFNSGDDILIVTPSLTYPAFASEGNAVNFAGAGIESSSSITPQTTGTVYYSMLINVNNIVAATGTNGGYFAGFGTNTSTFGATLWTKKVSDTSYNLGVEVRTASGATTTFHTEEYLTQTTYFVVVAYTFGPDANDDTVKMWINPAITATESTPTVLDTHTGTDLASINLFFLRQDSVGNTPDITVDELRIGTSWTDVVPQSAGIAENNIPGLKMYPNPAKNGQTLFITSDSSVEKNVAIYNVLGRKVLEATTQQNTINTNGLTTGVYMVKITEEGKTSTRKLVIQ